jgi:hypothetical protein
VQYYEGKRRITRRLAYVEDYPTKRSVMHLVDLGTVNKSTDASVTLDSFIETVYLPFAKERKRASKM